MPEPIEPHRIGILVHPKAQQAAVLGLSDMLEAAARFGAASTAAIASLEVVHLHSSEGLPEPERPLTVLIVPPSLAPQFEFDPDELSPIVAWLCRRHAQGTLLCSVCAGAFLLAETGLLAGREATTHWTLAERFAERYPDINLDTDRLIIDDGDVITAGGLMAWVDLGLRLIARLMGTSVMLTTARFFLVDPGGREQRFYRVFAPNLIHGDVAILRVQRWLQANFQDKVSLLKMSDEAGLSDRTFIRRFQKATGLRPTQYLQHLRVGKARDLLELSKRSVDDIAWEVGYGDPGALRKVFRRIMGLSPSEYRRRFSLV